MGFTVTFEISPAGAFGLPQSGVTVLPGAAGTFSGDIYDGKTGAVRRYGVLSSYRQPDEAVAAELNIVGVAIHVRDNIAYCDVDAPTSGAAYIQAASAVDRLLQHLTLTLSQSLTYAPRHIIGEEGLHPLPLTTLAHVTMYSLPRIADAFKTAEEFVGVSDARLDQALHYYDHALFLYSNRLVWTDMLSRHFRQLISAAFLNIWKAISTVIGEPGEKDYQSRYRMLGFTHDYFTKEIERVRQLRNDYDIAHYHEDRGRLEEVEANFGQASRVATEVLMAYRERLSAT